jgi:DNA (cytosine-5)-methyltransferase 1
MARRRTSGKASLPAAGHPAVPHHRGRPGRPPRHRDSPDPSDLEAVQDWVRDRRRPTAIDLFAGAGGLSLGLHQAGFDVLVGADSDAWAMETHAANLPGLTWTGDLADPTHFLQALEVWGIETVSLVAGGVPCQPFSRAGRSRIAKLVEDGQRIAHDKRADLWQSFISVVERLRPEAVLVENVPDLPRWNDGSVLIGFQESLSDLGYSVEARILDGFRFGVPQHRQRLILIGVAGDRRHVWPEPTDAPVLLEDAIRDLPVIPRAQRAEELPYDCGRITSEFQRRMRRGMKGKAATVVHDHISRDVRPDDLEAFDLLEEGQTYVDLPEHLRRYRSDVFTDKYKRLSWKELCRSITAHIAKDGYWYIHPEQHRTLSVREAARVQTFPDDFRFAGMQTHRYRQIGNAVPPTLGRVVGEALLATLAGPECLARERDLFRRSLLAWHGDQPVRRPWRTASDPWHVLIGELALRRAPEGEVAAMFRRLRQAARNPRRVVADEAGIADLLRSIGLRSAVDSLLKIARDLVEQYDGRVPDDSLELRSLPGVGDYLSEAVLCFGFNRRSVLVDTNTTRVCTRLSGRDVQQRFQLRLDLHHLAGAPGPDREFNRALLDLGESLCRPTAPLCGECPVRALCAHGQEQEQGRPARDAEKVKAVVA